MDTGRFSVTALLHQLIFYLAILDDAIGQRTAIMVKRKTTRDSEPIKLKTESFREFVLGSDIIIDRSLFIKEILEQSHKRVIITCPPKWSKTINLDMVKHFLKIETDSSGNRVSPIQRTFAYKLFMLGELANDTRDESFQTPFLIAQHKNFTDQYLGQYPVVYIRLKFVEGMNDVEAILSIKGLLYQAFKPHMFLMEVMKVFYQNVPENETVKKAKALEYYHSLKRMFREMEDDDAAITDCLNLLCKLLYRHYGKKVMVLIDDFDLPFYKFLYRKHFPDSDIKYVLNRLEDVLSPILADDYKYVERIIMTGTYRFTDILGPTVDAMPSYTLANNPWLEYFAISGNDVRDLFRYLGKSDHEYKAMISWYMGFKGIRDPELTLGTPYSINAYVATNVSAIYSSQFPEFFYWFEMNRIRAFRRVMESLVNKEAVIVQVNDLLFDKNQMRECKEVANKPVLEVVPVPQHLIDLEVSYLCAAGYLNMMKPNATSVLANVTIPNIEALTVISRKMKTYYSKVYGLPYMTIDKVVGNIGVYMKSQNLQPSNVLLERLNLMFYKLKFPDPIRSNLSHDEMMYEVFNYLSIKLRNLAKMDTKLWKDKDQSVIYLLGIRETHGMIIAFQNTKNVEELLVMARLKQSNFKQYPNLTCHKFMAIAHNGKNTSLATDCDFIGNTTSLR